MALDELGADPYQRAAIGCARKGAFVTILSVCAMVGAFVKGGDQALYLAGGSLACAVFSFGVARWQLSKESLGWSDMC
ncbi:hypothetical protein KFE25_008565 [Diacronema lutheri]|uniref:Uncharacterized protein n=1 Tax=Diacronema lutheri TaxID=2081491 RepID=A0A8J5XTC4_DIALT|nr:hypothetical protein KFE25_008565 [Diacronema lutheri]